MKSVCLPTKGFFIKTLNIYISYLIDLHEINQRIGVPVNFAIQKKWNKKTLALIQPYANKHFQKHF